VDMNTERPKQSLDSRMFALRDAAVSVTTGAYYTFWFGSEVSGYFTETMTHDAKSFLMELFEHLEDGERLEIWGPFKD
jgi:hypothetical protein